MIATALGVGVLLLAPGWLSRSETSEINNDQGGNLVSNQTAQPAQPANVQPGKANKPEKSPGEQLLEVVPDGGSISYDELTKKVGPEVSQMFSWAKPKSISRKGNHFIVECEPGASVDAGGVTLKLAEKVEADLTVYPDGIGLSNVKGANVSWAGFNLLKVREVRIQRDGTDKVKVSGKADISRFLPSVPFSVTLSADDLK